MPTESTTISIVLLTRNRCANLRLLIEILSPQLEPEDQLLIATNDNSDDTDAYVSELESSTPQILRYTPPSGLSLYEYFYLSCTQARHDNILLLNDDELFHSRILSFFRSSLVQHPQATLVLGNQLILDLRGGHSLRDFTVFSRERALPGPAWIESQAKEGVRFTCSCFAFRRSEASLKYFRKNQVSADTLFVLAQGQTGTVVELPKYFCTWTLHEGNFSRREYTRPQYNPLHRALPEVLDRTSPTNAEMIKNYEARSFNIYWANAFQAALPDGNLEGFRHCTGIALSLQRRLPHLMVSKICSLPGVFQILGLAARAARKLLRARNKCQQHTLSDVSIRLAKAFELPQTLVTRYLAIFGIHPENAKN